MKKLYAIIYVLFLCKIALTQVYKTRDTNEISHKAIPFKVPFKEAQPVNAGKKYNFRYYSLREGLTQTRITKIFVDSRHILWIGTYGGGINKFNGESFEIINKRNGLSNDIIWDFAEDKDGRIWIATDKGVNIYNGRNFEYLDESKGLQSRYVWCLHLDKKGRMWIGTSKGGVSVYAKGKISTFTTKNSTLPDDQIWDIAEDKNGTIWLGTHDHGAVKYENGKFESLALTDEQKKYTVRSILSTSSAVWFGTENGLIKYENNTLKLFNTENGLPGKHIRDIFEAQDGTIWFATDNGAASFDGSNFNHYSTTEGLASNNVKCVYKDQWKNIWFGTNDKGLCQLNDLSFNHYTEKQNLPANNIACVYEDVKGDIWMGTEEKGLVKLSNGKFYYYGPEQGFKWNSVQCIYQDSKGNYWFGTATDGIIKFDGKHFYQYVKGKGPSENRIYAITEDAKGNLWFATVWSANRFDGENFYYYNQAHGFPYHLTLSACTDKNKNVWIGTFGGGVCKIEGNKFTAFNDSTGLKCNSVFSLCQDKWGNMWFSTYGEGVAVLKNNWESLPHKKRWKYFDITNGLNDDGILFIRPDKEGNIWMGSINGLNKIETSEQSVFEKEPVIKKYGFTEGFSGIECIFNAFVADRNNHLWIPSAEMLSVYKPGTEQKEMTAPVLQLRAIKLKWENVHWETLKKNNGVGFNTLDLWNNTPKQLELPHYFNHLQFDFIGIIFNRAEQVQYQWKMEGADGKWSPWTKKHEISYNLAPGKYTLLIKTRNADKVESEIFKYSFIIHKPFWQTWWFRSLVVCSLLFGVWVIFRWRTAALRKRQAVLEKTVEERTAEVIKQKEVIEEKQKEIIDSIKYASRIQKALLPRATNIQKELNKLNEKK